MGTERRRVDFRNGVRKRKRERVNFEKQVGERNPHPFPIFGLWEGVEKRSIKFHKLEITLNNNINIHVSIVILAKLDPKHKYWMKRNSTPCSKSKLHQVNVILSPSPNHRNPTSWEFELRCARGHNSTQ